MEEQGLNTVFNTDKSTWKVIDSFSQKENPKTISEDFPSDKKATKETINLYHNL